jgi:EAL domain-containing protein (putative c-di-GMP-specific phosphodiesterase class I)
LRLRACLRRSDLLSRVGGDEFTAVITDLNDSGGAVRVAEKLLAALQEPFHWEDQELFLSASIGISLFPRDGRDVATLLRNADVAMYRAKSRGRNTFELFAPELAAAALQLLEIENSLRRALERNEFRLLYHPQVDRDGRLAAFEALLVWEHPKRGLIPPSDFIPVAEESGMIIPIGTWAVQQACHQCAAWRSQGLPPVTVAVNISATQFARRDFVDIVAQALSATGLDPTRLELELTENVLLRRLEESACQMERLRALGVSIAVDDFGTGYSSLSYLRRLPLDVLKLDQSFLPAEGRHAGALPLIEAIIALAHGLGLKVVAEGVERRQQFEALKAAGCDRFQGYLWGEPLPPEAAARLLREGLPPLPDNA